MLVSLVEVHGKVARESFSEGLVKKWLLDANAGGAFPWADPFQVVTIQLSLVHIGKGSQTECHANKKIKIQIQIQIQIQVEGMQEALRSDHLGRVFFAGEYTAKVDQRG